MKRKLCPTSELSYHVSSTDRRLSFTAHSSLATFQPLLKPLLAEIWFLTEHYNDLSQYVLVYAGSMDERWLVLKRLFPKLRFVIFDPNSCLLSHGVLRVVSCPLTETSVTKIRLSADELVLFICHWYTLEKQMECCQILKPLYAMLTLKLPFVDGSTSFFAPYKPDQIRYSAFAKPNATDVRVVINSWPDVIQYDHKSLEERCCFYNSITRVQRYTPFPRRSNWKSLKIDFCGDCCHLLRLCLNLLGRIRFGPRLYSIGITHTIETLLVHIPFPAPVAFEVATFAGIAEHKLFAFVKELLTELQILPH